MFNILLGILISVLAGAIGSFFTMPAIPAWYALLHKPVFNPPNWIFAPVWTTLYVLMGLALGLIANTKTKEKKLRNKAYLLFATQLILNTAWSILFFGLKQPLLALIEIFILLASIILTTLCFAKINKTASYLLYPYIGWVSFASILTAAIVIFN